MRQASNIMEASNAAMDEAHGKVFGDLNPTHKGINATLAIARKYF